MDTKESKIEGEMLIEEERIKKRIKKA